MEFWLLRRSMNRKIGVTGVPLGRIAVLWGAALAAAVPAIGVKLVMGVAHPVYLAAVSLPLFAIAYLFFTTLARVPEAAEFRDRISRVIRRAG
jgi:putative peptidoglycan lipid II flippase